MQRSSTSRTNRIVDRGIRKLPLFWIAILTGMASLLIMVAVLQYRWTRELSVATEARIGSTLQPSMLGWHLDFYSELSTICVALQVGPDAGARDNWNDYLHRYVDWSHESVENFYANPNLIKNIYIWETSDSAKLRLLRLNANEAKIEIPSAPEDLQPLLARLQAKSSNLSVGLRAWEFPDASAGQRPSRNGRLSHPASQRSDIMTGWPFDKNI